MLPTSTPTPTPTPIITINIQQAQGQGVNAGSPLNLIVSQAITLIFGIAVILVLIMLIWGAIQWIMSGGDKEAVGKARGRITHALVGLAILALAFLIITVAGQILGIDVLNLQIPKLGK